MTTNSAWIATTVRYRLRKLLDNDNELQIFLSGSSQLLQLPTYSCLNCANSKCAEPPLPCIEPGTLACSKCRLVKYCCKKCQIDHWPKHRQDCKHPYLKPDWQPAWSRERRKPAFVGGPPNVQFGNKSNYVWGNIPAIDCLNIPRNEGLGASTTDLKLCFAASGDIRNLVRTINGLPNNYRGKCSVLFNDKNPIVFNRNVVILFALLSHGPTIDEAAEFASHLTYSAGLSEVSAAHLYRCLGIIYGRGGWEGQKLTSGSLNTRGVGQLHLFQSVEDMKGPLEMFVSNYTLSEALAHMRSVMLHPSRVDYRDRRSDILSPAHRMADAHFRESGILAPFSADTSHCTQPNRLLFSADGEWLTLDNANPLQGWDIPSVCASGRRHGVDPNDIYGCLLFHVKDEFAEFARRIKNFDIEIYMTQFDARMLSQMISSGNFKPFHKGCFDRVETSNVADYIGPGRVIGDWGPLLNRQNKHATLLIHFMNWNLTQQDGQYDGSDTKNRLSLTERTATALNINLADVLKQQKSKDSPASPLMTRLLGHLDVFYDNSKAFSKFLRDTDVEEKAKCENLRLRSKNAIHTKRFGIPLSKQSLKVPDISKEEFYDLYVLGGADAPVRFVEFEPI